MDTIAPLLETYSKVLQNTNHTLTRGRIIQGNWGKNSQKIVCTVIQIKKLILWNKKSKGMYDLRN